MSIENVEDLITDILGVPDDAIADAKWWFDITSTFAAAIRIAKNILVINAESDRFIDGNPYLQICYEDDGAMTIEAVSSKFLKPGLSPDARNTLAELGWGLTEWAPGLPNYSQFIHPEEANPLAIAQLFAKTFRDVYGVRSTDSIDIGPQYIMDVIAKERRAA